MATCLVRSGRCVYVCVHEWRPAQCGLAGVCKYVFVNGDLLSAVWPVCVCEFVNGDLPSAVWPVCVCVCS